MVRRGMKCLISARFYDVWTAGVKADAFEASRLSQGHRDCDTDRVGR